MIQLLLFSPWQRRINVLSFEYEKTFSIPLIRDKQHLRDICVAKQHLSRQDSVQSPVPGLSPVPFAPIYHNMLQYNIDLNGKTILFTIKYADTTPLEQDFGFKPSTPLREGLRKSAEWFKAYNESKQL